MSNDMFHGNGRVSVLIRLHLPACLKKELKRNCLHIWAPPGVLKVETFVEEKMNSTISPPIRRGKRHIISRMNTDSYTISPSKRMMKSSESKCFIVVGTTVAF